MIVYEQCPQVCLVQGEHRHTILREEEYQRVLEAMTMEVTITESLTEMDTCVVKRHGQVVFDGVSKDALLTNPEKRAKMDERLDDFGTSPRGHRREHPLTDWLRRNQALTTILLVVFVAPVFALMLRALT